MSKSSGLGHSPLVTTQMTTAEYEAALARFREQALSHAGTPPIILGTDWELTTRSFYGGATQYWSALPPEPPPPLECSYCRTLTAPNKYGTCHTCGAPQ